MKITELFLIIFDSCDCGETLCGYTVSENGATTKVATVSVDSWEAGWQDDGIQRLFSKYDFSGLKIIFVNF
jgi:hypothetical protein